MLLLRAPSTSPRRRVQLSVIISSTRRRRRALWSLNAHRDNVSRSSVYTFWLRRPVLFIKMY